MQIELQAKIRKIHVQTTGEYPKRLLWIDETEGQFPGTLQVEFTKDGMSRLDNFKEGQIVTVKANLVGKPYTSKKDGSEGVFMTLRGWYIQVVKEESQPVKQYAPNHQPSLHPELPVHEMQPVADDDLPF